MTLTQLNALPLPQLKEALIRCCGSCGWVTQMAAHFPMDSEQKLLNQAHLAWEGCSDEDAKEAFSHHAKIGDIELLKKKFTSTSQWAEGEQAGVQKTSQQVLEALAESNKEYEEKYGFIFIVCASGKSAEEMLSMLKLRLLNKPEDELLIAMEEQAKITRLRLKKLLA